MRTPAIQSGDGVMFRSSPDGIVMQALHAAPSNSQPGYAKGALYINLSGSLGSLVYCNTGSTTSTTWTNIV